MVTSTFWDFVAVGCSNPQLGRKVQLQFCNFTNSTFGSQNDKQKQIFVREMYEITQNTFFLQLETINTNSFLLLSNQRPPYIK